MKFLGTVLIVAGIYIFIINPAGNRLAKNVFHVGGQLLTVVVDVSNDLVATSMKKSTP